MQNHKTVLDLIEEKISKDVFKLLITSEPEEYMNLILDLLSIAVKEKDMSCIYISYTRPFITLNEEFNKRDLKNIFVIDCVSVLGNPGVKSTKEVFYLQSPSSLEEIAIDVSRFLAKHSNEKERSFLLFDSITTASVFLSEKEIEKLLQTLFIKCSIKKCGCIVLAQKVQTEDSIRILAQSCGFDLVEHLVT